MQQCITIFILRRIIPDFITIVLLITSSYSQAIQWDLSPDSANIALLKFDFQLHTFEGAFFSNYAPCDTCDTNSFPIDYIYHEPVDFGDITFRYLPELDTLFFGTIIWMGTGDISIPASFDPPELFAYWDSVTFTPDTTYHLAMEYWDTTWWEQEAVSMWSEFQNLGLDNLFAFDQEKTTVGLYLYPPSVGMFDPNVAKWILFFYQDLTREPDYDTTYALSFFPIQIGNNWQYSNSLISYPIGHNEFLGYETVRVTGDTVLDNGLTYRILDGNFNDIESQTYVRIDTSLLLVYKYNPDTLSYCQESEFILFDLSKVFSDTSSYSLCGDLVAWTETGTEALEFIPGTQPTVSYAWWNLLSYEYALTKGIGASYFSAQELGGSAGHLIAATVDGVEYGEYYIDPTTSFPLHPDQYWHYSDGVDSFAVVIDDTIDYSETSFYYLENYRPLDFSQYYFSVSGDRVSVLSGDTSFVMYDFAADSGASWELIVGGMPSMMFVVGKNETVITPLDTFDNCIEFEHLFGLDYEYFEWFSPGVGLVQRDNITIAGTHRWQLFEFGPLENQTVETLPSEFMLYQNFPNPFNPVTTIRYDLPEQTHVRLTVIDLLGREVVALIDREQSPGTKEVRFDATNLASGMYFYSLSTAQQQISKKLVVLK